MDSSNLEENEFVCCEFEIAYKPTLQDLKKENHVYCGRIFLRERENFVFICTFCEKLFTKIEEFKFHMKYYHRNMKLNSEILDVFESDNTIVIDDNQEDYIHHEDEISDMLCRDTCEINDKQNVNEIPEISLNRTHGKKNKNIPYHQDDDADNNVKAKDDDEKINKINGIEKKSRILQDVFSDWLEANDEKLFQTIQSNNDKMNENISESTSDNSNRNSPEEIDFNEQNKILVNTIEEKSENIFKLTNINDDDQSKIQKKEEKLPIKRKFDCEFCGRNLYTKKRLQSHKLIAHHDTDVIIPINKNFTCEVCNKSFSIKEQLESHFVSFCLKTKNEKIKSSKKYLVNDTKNINSNEKILKEIIKSNPLECRFCHQKFKMQSQCAKHELLHTGEKPFSCKFCNKTFRLKKTLTHHTMVHMQIKPYKCDLCDSSFTVLANLTVHMRRHLGEKKYKCDYCDKKFVTSTERNSHSRFHTGEKPYKCSICNKQFPNCASYLQHLQVEHFENKVNCEQCNKTFDSNRCSMIHNLQHLKIKSFECDVCQKKFLTKRHLKIHMGCHSNVKNYLCSECGMKFRLHTSLLTHMKSHQPNNLNFECAICQKKYRWKANLTKHLKIHSNIKEQTTSKSYENAHNEEKK